MMIAVSAFIIVRLPIVCAHDENGGGSILGGLLTGGVAPDNCWYVNDGGNDVSSGTRGSYYEYNEYMIWFSSEPCGSVLTWNGKELGKTPLNYRFTGKIYTDENLVIVASPDDRQYTPRKARINLYRPMPRLIHFDFTRK